MFDLSFSDFESWAVILPAILALVGVGMSWRGLHLAGDSGKSSRILWGAASVATFLAALLIGAQANHDSKRQINEANTRAQSFKQQLASIQEGISALQSVVAPNGGSIDQTLFAAIAKIQSQQNELNALASQTSQLTQESRRPNDVYQGGFDIGTVGASTFDQTTKTLTFGYITTNQPIDFSTPLEFRHYLFSCSPLQPSGIMSSGAVQADTYQNLKCSLSGPAKQ